MTAGGRLIIVDPGLQGPGGHHFTVDLALVEQARKHGLSFEVMGGERIGGSAQAARLNARPAFVHAPYHLGVAERDYRDSPDPLASERDTCLYLNRYFLERLEADLSPRLEDGDVVVFHSVNAAMIAALEAWIGRAVSGRSARVVVFLLVMDFADPAGGGDTWRIDLYRRFLATLAGLPEGRVTLAAAGPVMAERLRALAGGRPPILAAPHFVPESRLDPRPEPRRGDPPVIGFLGHGRFERGLHLVPEIVARLRAARPGACRFVVQANPDPLDPGFAGGPPIGERLAPLAMGNDVRLIAGALDAEAYYGALAGVDILLLPYQGRAAGFESGLSYEALAFAKPVVAPRGSAAARLVAERGGGLATFEQASAPAVAAACASALDRLDDLTARARAAAPAWRRECGVAAFFDRLFSAPA